jgi:hypothetical protein
MKKFDYINVLLQQSDYNIDYLIQRCLTIQSAGSKTIYIIEH